MRRVGAGVTLRRERPLRIAALPRQIRQNTSETPRAASRTFWVLLQGGPEVGQVSEVEVRGGEAVGERVPGRVQPGRRHADSLGAGHVDVRPVAHEETLPGRNAHLAERALEDVGARL